MVDSSFDYPCPIDSADRPILIILNINGSALSDSGVK